MIEERKHNIYMNGREVFKHAVTRFPEVIKEGLEFNDLNLDDLHVILIKQL